MQWCTDLVKKFNLGENSEKIAVTNCGLSALQKIDVVEKFDLIKKFAVTNFSTKSVRL